MGCIIGDQEGESQYQNNNQRVFDNNKLGYKKKDERNHKSNKKQIKKINKCKLFNNNDKVIIKLKRKTKQSNRNKKEHLNPQQFEDQQKIKVLEIMVQGFIKEQNNKICLKPKSNIPCFQAGNTIKIDTNKCMYFGQGHNKVYTHDLLQLYSAQASRTQWMSVTDQSYIHDSAIDIYKLLGVNEQQLIILNTLGTFVLSQNKWGFLIMLKQIEGIYDGELTEILKNCIKISFFQQLLKKYSYYMMENKNINVKDLKSTQFDAQLTLKQKQYCKKLFKHQIQQVGWMINLQRKPNLPIQNYKTIQMFDSGYYVNPQSVNPQLYQFNEIEQTQKLKVKGSILASDIGTGKTASMLYLIMLSQKLSQRKQLTLIITPDSIIYQWGQQINKFIPDFKVILFQRSADIKIQNINNDISIVLISRQTLQQDKMGLLKKLKYKRIIIDEIHEVMEKLQKGKNQQLYMKDFDSQMIWGVTGTPYQVDYLDNLSVIGKILKFPPTVYEQVNIDNFRNFFLKNCIRKNTNLKNLPIVKKQISYSEMQGIQNLLYKAKLKFSVNEDEARKICCNILPYFEIRDANNDTSIQKGIVFVEKKLNNELEQLNKKLKASDELHKKNIQQKLNILQSQRNFYKDILLTLSKSNYECIICFDQKSIKTLVLTNCMHYCCSQCYSCLFKLAVVSQCPLCKGQITKTNCIIQPLKAEKIKNKNKIQMMMDSIKKVPEEDKIIIFTQFHNLVERIGNQFDKINLPFIVLKGLPSQINYSLNIFRNDPQMKILILSIEQAASGINIIEANHVYFAHPIFGKDYEMIQRVYRQCIGRVHRIGQTKPVYAKLFISKETIEEDYSKYFME